MDKQQKQIVKNRVVAKWRALFELQKSSSTTITEFCKLHNVLLVASFNVSDRLA
jgi:hypothetical protein